MAIELHLDVELHRPATVSFVQGPKSNLGEVPMLVLSSFLHVPRVSALVRGVAAAALLLLAAGRAPALLRRAAERASSARCASRRVALPCRRAASPPARAARHAAGHGPAVTCLTGG